ncbi:MAG: carboxypeptidase-like regulatory domain-containing protein [Bacteroidota bacterium]
MKWNFRWSLHIVLLSLMLPFSLLGQEQTNKVYQFSGLVISRSNDRAIPFVRIQVNKTRRGAVTNSEGFYSIPVGYLDTLHFSHLGYHGSKLVVSEYLREYQGDMSQYIYAINYMLEDSFAIDTVFIFPYDTPEELRTAVVNMEIPTNTLEDFARENLDPKTLHTLMATLPVDGSERLAVARNMYFDSYQTKNLLPTIGFDPIAATRLLQYVAQRARRRKNKDLNYWED